ncbi:hypothetical protein GGU11DRAFT_229547 [Lentinula aff. detonsa]|nr:hypothetical protein GGU11DRAFT_229547 [Lentinula aff. detonsa]
MANSIALTPILSMSICHCASIIKINLVFCQQCISVYLLQKSYPKLFRILLSIPRISKCWIPVNMSLTNHAPLDMYHTVRTMGDYVPLFQATCVIQMLPNCSRHCRVLFVPLSVYFLLEVFIIVIRR